MNVHFFQQQIAIEGCLHGELNQVYSYLLQLQQTTKITIDLLIICGDFQATRDLNDLQHMHCPPKYKSMGSFKEYFSGEKVAPFLTIFIGGNHEAVNYMRDLYFGGWIAQNIYYLGQGGSILVRKGKETYRITGMSGIYNHRDFQYITKTERIPLYGKDRISAYHTKQMDVFRLELLGRICEMQRQEPETYGKGEQSFDIFVSHDWPKDIAFYGDLQELLKYKPFLKKQIHEGQFGSPPLKRLLSILKPEYWFSAHMHVKYAALFPHENNIFTHFLALDKCLQKRSCLQVLRLKKKGTEDTENEKVTIQTDKVWLSVLQLTANLQRQNLVLYKYVEKNLCINNGKMMNELIEMYPKIRENLKDIEVPKMSKSYEQIEQTMILFKELSISEGQFEGIIFQKKKDNLQGEKKQNQNCDDQIQLDL